MSKKDGCAKNFKDECTVGYMYSTDLCMFFLQRCFKSVFQCLISTGTSSALSIYQDNVKILHIGLQQ